MANENTATRKQSKSPFLYEGNADVSGGTSNTSNFGKTAGIFRVVGFLIPSRTQKSFKVYINGRFLGLVSREAILRATKSYPMQNVEICEFVNAPFSAKEVYAYDPATEQSTLDMQSADPDQLPEAYE